MIKDEVFNNLQLKEIKKITDWVQQTANSIEDLRQPSLPYAHFESYILSLFGLLRGVADVVPFAPDWTPDEFEEDAALFLAMHIIRREAAAKSTSEAASSTTAGEEAATRHKWSTVQDAIGELKEFEDALVEDGESILSGDPKRLAAWIEDVDDGTFEDAAGDVERRIDFVEHPDNTALFHKSIINAERITAAKALLSDARAFFRGREGRNTPKTVLTLTRDQAFTVLFPRIERLQRILRAAYRGNQEARTKIEGGHWKRLARLTRPRAKRKSDPTEEKVTP